LKMVGDGTKNGTTIVDADSGSILDKVESFEWFLTQGMGSSYLRLGISNVHFDIDPTKTFTPGQPKSLLCGPIMNLKVVGDGTETGTYLVDETTEDVLEDVKYLQWSYDDDAGCVVLTFEVSNFIMEIIPVVTPANFFPKTPAISPPSMPNVPGHSYNPFLPPASPPDPLLPGMPPDLLSLSVSNCNHEWVNVGFSSLKYVCKKCNAERNS